ncbi:MAG: hypothetical protein IKZ82_10405 [Clostridia bacterium]|nr:hypothetical protein [Clostridia bacterium]
MDRIKAMMNIDQYRASQAERSLVIVSLGDSYSSGEGIEPYYRQGAAKRYTDPDFLAHRSERSWPARLTLPGVCGMMAEHRDENWYFAAASGAKAMHIWEKQSKTGRTRVSRATDNTPLYRTYPTQKLPPQLDIFKALGDKKADYVTLTLGGNDAGFGEVITHAIAGHTYVGRSFLKLKLASLWRQFYASGGIRDSLLKAYRLIAEAAGPQAQIIVAGYPRLFSPYGSRTLFSKQAASLMNDAVSDLNKHLEYLIGMLRVSGFPIHFVSVEKEFEAHGAYSAFSDDPDAINCTEYIHRISFGADANDIDASKTAYSGSLHPNYLGSEIYRACVQRKIDELEAARLRICIGLAPLKSVPLHSVPALLFEDQGSNDTAEFWAVDSETAEKALITATANASKLPYIVGGAAAVVSVGALVGTAAIKRARAIHKTLTPVLGGAAKEENGDENKGEDKPDSLP